MIRAVKCTWGLECGFVQLFDTSGFVGKRLKDYRANLSGMMNTVGGFGFEATYR